MNNRHVDFASAAQRSGRQLWMAMTLALIVLVFQLDGKAAWAQTAEQRAQLLRRTFDVLHQEQYDSAFALCEDLRTLLPEDPTGDIMRATVYQAMMRVYRVRAYEAQFDSLCRRGDQLAQKHARKENSAEAWFMLGSAKGNLALHRFNRGEWAGGLQDAIQALNAMKQARQRDREFYDPDLALGLYEYWKSKKLGMGMGLFAGARKDALRMLEAVQAKAHYVGRDAELTLQDLYMHEGDFAHALAINENLLPALPQNASVLYHRAILLEKLGRSTEALAVWESLYTRLQNFRQPTHAFMAECQLHRARLLQTLKAEAPAILAAVDLGATHMKQSNRAQELTGPFENFDEINKALHALRTAVAANAAAGSNTAK